MSTVAYDDELEVQTNGKESHVLEDIGCGERFNLNGADDMRRIADLLNEAADTIEENER